MEYIAHEYQKQATEFLINNPKAALFLECGLGKSVITLSAISELIGSAQVKKVLIIAPLRVARDTWPNELDKWDHLMDLSYSVVLGPEDARKKALAIEANIYIINRENVDWLVNESDTVFDYDMIVLDELTSFKSYTSKRVKALCSVALHVKRVVGLTGTPAPNGLMDLWAQFKVLDGGERLGRYITHYREKYFVPDKFSQHIVYTWKPKLFAEERIYESISDITLSMKSCNYLKLPPLVMNDVFVNLSYKEDCLIKKFKRDLVLEFASSDITASNAASLSLKLLQMANGAIYDDEHDVINIHNRKLEALEDLIEAANGKPVLIAYWYKHDATRITKLLEGRVEHLNSPESIRRWNEGKIELALIHPASAGHGLNLQAGGSTLIWYSLTWNLELYQQTIARLYREGQAKTVVVHHIICKDSIDEQVRRSLNRKDVTQEALIDAVRAEIRGW
ncbi:MAG: DEAD/DEAH box helicase [Holosporales bacterium]|nr:DEAD/DEAH box helicase [Holosporales bacterium]